MGQPVLLFIFVIIFSLIDIVILLSTNKVDVVAVVSELASTIPPMQFNQHIFKSFFFFFLCNYSVVFESELSCTFNLQPETQISLYLPVVFR